MNWNLSSLISHHEVQFFPPKRRSFCHPIYFHSRLYTRGWLFLITRIFFNVKKMNKRNNIFIKKNIKTILINFLKCAIRGGKLWSSCVIFRLKKNFIQLASFVSTSWRFSYFFFFKWMNHTFARPKAYRLDFKEHCSKTRKLFRGKKNKNKSLNEKRNGKKGQEQVWVNIREFLWKQFFFVQRTGPCIHENKLKFFLYGQKRRSYHPAFSLIFFIYFSHSVKRSRELTLDLF